MDNEQDYDSNHRRYQELLGIQFKSAKLASLVQDAGETIGALILSFDPERDDMQHVERTVAVYTDAFERVLGVPPGSLTLVDDQTLKEWFVSPRENEVEMKS